MSPGEQSARPPDCFWQVEGVEDDFGWCLWNGVVHYKLDDAVTQRDRLRRLHPTCQFRIIRINTTYTVDGEP